MAKTRGTPNAVGAIKLDKSRPYVRATSTLPLQAGEEHLGPARQELAQVLAEAWRAYGSSEGGRMGVRIALAAACEFIDAADPRAGEVFDRFNMVLIAALSDLDQGITTPLLKKSAGRDTPRQPVGEAKMLLEWAPFLRDELPPERILHLSDHEFEAVCLRVWSIRDHARRVANASLNLPPGRPYDIETKTKALAKLLLSRRAQNGSSILQVINYVLYDGNDDSLPARLWEATSNS